MAYVPFTTTVEEGGDSMRSYRHLGETADVLGQRLDAARSALARSTRANSEWGKRNWQLVIDRLMFQWKHLPALHDADAQVSIIPRWTVDYNFYEKDDGTGHTDWLDRFAGSASWGLATRLNESWERHRELRLARAQY
jgi:hypothetical protein